jgi:hypothetical protein
MYYVKRRYYNSNFSKKEVKGASPVRFVVSLDNGPLRISFASLNHRVGLGINLETKVFSFEIFNWPNFYVFERDDSFWYILCRVLKIIETSVAQYEPASLPSLPTEME